MSLQMLARLSGLAGEPPALQSVCRVFYFLYRTDVNNSGIMFITNKTYGVTRCAVCLLLLLLAPSNYAQRKSVGVKLPSPDKLVADYLRAIGGKKRVGSLRDTTLIYSATNSDATTALRIQTKSPAARRMALKNSKQSNDTAATPRSAWTLNADGTSQTLTDAQARNAKLQAALETNRFADYKRYNVLARTAALESVNGEAAYAIEFSTREGGRLRYHFSRQSKLLLQMTDDARGITIKFSDYRQTEKLLEPYQLEISDKESTTAFTLQSASYNTLISDTVFEPPTNANLDAASLFVEVARNQDELESRVSEYTYLLKQTTRTINKRGELENEEVQVYEVYPVANGSAVRKLISKDGVALTPEQADKEAKRAGDELEKAEREREKRARKRDEAKAKKAARTLNENSDKNRNSEDATNDNEQRDDPSLSAFLRACEFVAARREMFRERETVVFDFRPRLDFKPRNREEAIVSRLAGVVWIDPQDKQIVRLEARFIEGYKIGGGLVANLKSGTAFVFEQARTIEGVWLPRFAQVDIGVKVLLLANFDINLTNEYSDYKRFSTSAEKETLDAPQQP